MTYTDRRASARTAPRTGLFVTREWVKTPDPWWQQELDRIAPPGDTVSSLVILWEPGDPWEKLERWVIWQRYPLDRHGRAIVPQMIDRAALEGASPRVTGHYCGAGWCLCAMKANRWVDGNPLSYGIDYRTWELYQQTGRYHRRWWVVQGPDGGHPYRYDKWEQKLRRMAKQSPDAPFIGDLPYAEPNRLTWQRIGGLNLLRAHRELQDFTSRTAQDFARADRDRDEAYEAAKLNWISDRLTDAAPRFQKALKREGFAPKPWEKGPAFDVDEARATALTEGDHRPLGV